MVKLGIVGREQEWKQALANTAFELSCFETIELAFEQFESLLQLDAILLNTKNETSFNFAHACIKNGKSVFIQNPLILTLKQAESLVSSSRESNVLCMFGYHYGYTQAIQKITTTIQNPTLLEVIHETMNVANEQLILEMMLPDVQLILSLIKSELKRISCFGFNNEYNSVQFVNARLEFSNGSVANFTTSSQSKENKHALHIYQKDLNALIDLRATDSNAPLVELFHSFINCLTSHEVPMASALEHLQSLDIAYRILKKINFPSVEYNKN